MIDLGNRLICDDGTVILTPDAAMEVLYSGGDLANAWIMPCDDATMHNDSNRMLDTGLPRLNETDAPMYGGMDWYGSWHTPEPYASMDVLSHCMSRCNNDAQIKRVEQEYPMFEQRGMVPVLRHLVYMVDSLRDAGVFWGVGRGSSVSSMILYLIGINRIDPIEHGLEIDEFLK